MRVLVVEDDLRLGRMLRRVLAEERYAVDLALDGTHGEDLGATEPYDVIILDVMLPDRDGVNVCSSLRRRGVQTPILLLTALDAVTDRVRGLDAGADDYLPKPFAVAELLARLRSLTRRRATEVTPAQLRVDGLVLDVVRHEVRRDGRSIDLSPREYALLEYFLRHPAQVLTRTQLLEGVWGYEPDVTSNLVDAYVHNLREKIDRGARPKLLHTVRGVGYALRTE
ncbi:MAG: response regulator transcription factor [Dehalococcoidia bacterium]